MCSTWLQTTNIVETIGFALCFFLNTVLIVLISTSKTQFGNYKFLMLTFSVIGIVYSFFNFISKPNVHMTSTSFIVFTVLEYSHFNKFYGSIVVCVYCSCYAMMLSLLTIQFYYRYTSVTSPVLLFSRFSRPSACYWALVVLFYSTLWGTSSYFLCGPTASKDEELEPIFKQAYCLDPKGYAYVGPQYYSFVGQKRVIHLDAFSGIAILAGQMSASFGFVIFFGVKTQRTMNDLNNAGVGNRVLQRQLFRTLIIQTIIPMFFLYIPVSVMFLFPIFGWKLESVANLIPISVTIYPCLEPMVALLCIHEFKRRILACLSCGRYHSSSVATLGTTYSETSNAENYVMRNRIFENRS